MLLYAPCHDHVARTISVIHSSIRKSNPSKPTPGGQSTPMQVCQSETPGWQPIAHDIICSSSGSGSGIGGGHGVILARLSCSHSAVDGRSIWGSYIWNSGRILSAVYSVLNAATTNEPEKNIIEEINLNISVASNTIHRYASRIASCDVHESNNFIPPYFLIESTN